MKVTYVYCRLGNQRDTSNRGRSRGEIPIPEVTIQYNETALLGTVRK